MLPVPTNLITGFLGVGKTTAIKSLLTRKPEGEVWAVLVNEFGDIGIDEAAIIDGYSGNDTRSAWCLVAVFVVSAIWLWG